MLNVHDVVKFKSVATPNDTKYPYGVVLWVGTYGPTKENVVCIRRFMNQAFSFMTELVNVRHLVTVDNILDLVELEDAERP